MNALVVPADWRKPMAFKEAAIPDFVVKKAPLRDAAHKDLKEFLALSVDCVRVDISPFSNLNSAYTTYYSLARNYGYPVAVRRSEGKMYLLRKRREK